MIIIANSYRVIRLLKNQIYPTYQLHAFMTSKKTSPADGLRLAALTTLEWLRYRLGENLPDVLENLPSPDTYRTASDDCLASFHLNAGFMVDVVSLPQEGIWTLQIAEPDLGPDPGTQDQHRSPVAGRVIETNIAYKVVEHRLECGFQTVISDPEGTACQAETYRLAIIRQLAANPDFGLSQIIPLTSECTVIQSVDQLKSAIDLVHRKENDLPCVIFTQIVKQDSPSQTKPESLPPFMPAGLPSPSSLQKLSGSPLLGSPAFSGALPAIPSDLALAGKATAVPSDPPYDFTTFAKYGISLCRSYLLTGKLLDRLQKMCSLTLSPGDIVILEPTAFGGKIQRIPYKSSKTRQDEAMNQLRADMYNYPRGKEISYGHISFLSAAREALLNRTQSTEEQSAALSEQWSSELELLKTSWQAQLKEKDDECRDLRDQLYRQRQYCDRLEHEKDDLKEAVQNAEADCARKTAEKDALICALRRRLNQPKSHELIAEWAAQEFSGRLLIHPKAAALLNEKSARSVDVSLICDALDFLATDYWERRYNGLSTEEMNSRCSHKYGRPFDVVPTGTTSIEFTPHEYKIKYFIGARGKPVESALDYHLRVGNRVENLLRIYFLHDDEKQLIVVGSLPNHLRAVTIN